MDQVAGITSNTVPWEILRAAGFRPRLLEDELGPTPIADHLMEDVFERRIRVIFDRLCAGTWDDLEVVVIPRTSEQEHKLYLYLREAARLQYGKGMPRLYFYNLLHTRTPESYSYGLARTQEMAADFGASDDGLHRAIEEGNRARAALRQLDQLRQQGRCRASVALALIREFYTRDRAAFADAMPGKLDQLAANAPAGEPRILIHGAPLDHMALHLLLEQLGGYVVAEDDWRGARAAGETDVRLDLDPVTAIFEKYYSDTSSPRVHPPEQADDWFRRQLAAGRIDGIIFYEPLTDDVAGWSYPRQLEMTRTAGIPSIVIRQDGTSPSPQLIDQLSGFLQECKQG